MSKDRASHALPTGYILSNGRPMAFWLPADVTAADLNLDLVIGDSHPQQDHSADAGCHPKREHGAVAGGQPKRQEHNAVQP